VGSIHQQQARIVDIERFERLQLSVGTRCAHHKVATTHETTSDLNAIANACQDR
jgi:hypothetical protein